MFSTPKRYRSELFCFAEGYDDVFMFDMFRPTDSEDVATSTERKVRSEATRTTCRCQMKSSVATHIRSILP